VEVAGEMAAAPAGEEVAAPAGEEMAGEVAGPAPAQVPSAQPVRPVRLPSTGGPSVPPAAVLLVLTAGAGVYLSRFGGKRR
jgi:hypothetical protein